MRKACEICVRSPRLIVSGRPRMETEIYLGRKRRDFQMKRGNSERKEGGKGKKGEKNAERNE